MSKKPIVLLILMFTLAVVPTISAQLNQPMTMSTQSSKPLKCNLIMFLDQRVQNPHWKGFVFGDINGIIEVYENDPNPNYFIPPGSPNPTNEIFFERFVIKTFNGVITGHDIGNWDMATFKWSAYGSVDVSATGHWTSLFAYKVAELNGKTTSPFTNNVVTAWATITFSK